MSENEFNANEQAKSSWLRTPRRRPLGTTSNKWKNRRHIAAKLTESNDHLWQIFKKKTGYNNNSGINYLIHTHPQLQDDG
tara:strand:+ start:378 stop:617 length:240 start_codon:yes stop_codon:yes gene_type:complete